MKNLVTGGAGFVGSNLVDLLISRGEEVVVLDNFSSLSAKRSNINPNARLIVEDVEKIHKVLGKEKFDRIFHLAAQARIQPSFERPADYFWSNAMGTVEVLEYARTSESGIVVYATTSSKNHGNSRMTPYTFSKVVGEDACKMYSEIYDVKTALTTFYNVYGPREPQEGEWATVVAKFLRQHREGSPLTIVGDGEQSRDFTHVEDICEGLLRISQGEWKGHSFDIGRGEPIKILDLAKMISENYVHVPLRKNEGLHTLSEWRKTESLLRWRPQKSLKTYIDDNK